MAAFTHTPLGHLCKTAVWRLSQVVSQHCQEETCNIHILEFTAQWFHNHTELSYPGVSTAFSAALGVEAETVATTDPRQGPVCVSSKQLLISVLSFMHRFPRKDTRSMWLVASFHLPILCILFLPWGPLFLLSLILKSLPLGFLSTVRSHPLSSGDPGQLAPIVLPAWFVRGTHQSLLQVHSCV